MKPVGAVLLGRWLGQYLQAGSRPPRAESKQRDGAAKGEAPLTLIPPTLLLTCSPVPHIPKHLGSVEDPAAPRESLVPPE